MEKIYQPTNLEEHRSFQKHFETEDGKIAYLDIGAGEPILLVHGIPTSSWLYRLIIPHLVKQHFRVIAVDLLGYGLSDKPEGVEVYAHQKQGKRLLDLMEHLNIPQWTHVCHDGGGIWTWELMSQQADKVKNLVILNTILFKEGFKPPMTFKQGLIGKLYASLYRSSLFCRLMVNGTLKNGVHNPQDGLSKEEKRGYWGPMSEGVSKALYYFFTSFSYIFKHLPQYQQMLREAKIPTLIIWGKRDKILVGEKQIPLIAEAMNVSENHIHLLDDAAHFIQEEKPEEIAGWITNFVKDSR